MKKVLIIAAVSGFLVQFEQENVRLLEKLGYEVHYASNFHHPVYEYDETIFDSLNVRVHQIDIEQSPLKLFSHRKALRQLEELVAGENFTLIHCHTPMGGVLGRLVGRMFADSGIKVIYTAHGFHFYRGCPPLKYRFFRGIERYLAKDTDVLVTINQEDYKASETFSLKKQGKSYLIPGVGVDMKEYALPEIPVRLKMKEYMFGKSFYILISVGELRKNKNQRVIIKALGLLKKEGYDIHNLRYVLLGEGPDREHLKCMAEKYRISGQVIFAGYQKDIRPYLTVADAMAFPSHREGLGMAAIESLAMGVPVLAADNRGTKEYMIPQVNGLVYEATDVRGFAAGLKSMMENKTMWQDEVTRKRIRQSVERFQRSCSGEVMEYVYRRTM